MKKSFWLTFTLAALLAAPAQAQRKIKTKVKTSAAAPVDKASRLVPLFGGLSVAEAEQVVGPAFLPDIDRNFASRAEASKFFAGKGYEYLAENQPDTATYRFNLAWLLDQKNPDVYRGLGVAASTKPTPDESIRLLTQAQALSPNDTYILSDLGSSYLLRYGQTKKKKDLTQGMDFLQKAVAADPANAIAWQQVGRAYFYQENYAQAWEAVHKGQNLNVTSLDFDFLSELIAKSPDPQGTFK